MSCACSTVYEMVKTLSCTKSGNQEYTYFMLESFGVPRGTPKCNFVLWERNNIPKDMLHALADRSVKLRACSYISSGARRILTRGETKHAIFWAAGDNFVGHWLWRFTVQMDVNILTFWFALKANFTDVRPLTLKMRQERFLTKGSFFVRSSRQRMARIPRAPKARAKKNWRFLREILH